MYPEFKKFVNLIGHDITISGHATLPKCENPCKVETKQRIVASNDIYEPAGEIDYTQFVRDKKNVKKTKNGEPQH